LVQSATLAPVWEDASTRLAGRIVVLEPLGLEHEEGLFAASTDADVWRWLSIAQPRTRNAFRRWLDDALARASTGHEAPFATLDAATRTPIGSTRYLELRPEHRALEIGWTWLARSAWGTGANVEAKLLMLEHAFERLGTRRVEFKTDALNERSRAALAALPAQLEGVFRKHMLVRGGENRDSAWYAIVDDDWPAVRENLLRRLERGRENA
jgi:RimJ/RimL family protein N-acetyltransferase